jgi:hypothetical protein
MVNWLMSLWLIAMLVRHDGGRIGTGPGFLSICIFAGFHVVSVNLVCFVCVCVILSSFEFEFEFEGRFEFECHFLCVCVTSYIFECVSYVCANVLTCWLARLAHSPDSPGVLIQGAFRQRHVQCRQPAIWRSPVTRCSEGVGLEIGMLSAFEGDRFRDVYFFGKGVKGVSASDWGKGVKDGSGLVPASQVGFVAHPFF